MKEWKEIKNFPDYLASSDGEILSKERKNRRGHRHKERILKPRNDGYGYLKIYLTNDAGSFDVKLHRIIAETFIGDPGGLDINHKNGIKSDNRVDNLEIVTRRENVLHAYLTGLKKEKTGEERFCSKLKNKDVIEIRKMVSDGIRRMDIASIFNVSKSCINHIARCHTWRNVNE